VILAVFLTELTGRGLLCSSPWVQMPQGRWPGRVDLTSLIGRLQPTPQTRRFICLFGLNRSMERRALDLRYSRRLTHETGAQFNGKPHRYRALDTGMLGTTGHLLGQDQAG